MYWFVIVLVISTADRLASAFGEDGCDPVNEFHDATNGVEIHSPSYSQYPNATYPPNTSCRWKIARPGTNLVAMFGHGRTDVFGLRRTGNFCIDYVAIFPADYSESNEICNRSTAARGKYCGFTAPPNFVIDERGAVVEFCSWSQTSSDVYRGFSLVLRSTRDPVTALPDLPPLPCEGQTIINMTETNSTEVYIGSPAEHYPLEAMCSWVVIPDANKSLFINAERFDLLSRDSLMISTNPLNASDDAETAKSYEFSEKRGPTGLRLATDTLTLSFISGYHLDTSGVQGFRIRIQESSCSVNAGYCVYDLTEDVCFVEDMMCNGKTDCPSGADEICPQGCGIPPVAPVLSSESTKILGGTEARPHSWPWQVAFVISEKLLACSGSILDNSWVLTTADCCERVETAFKANDKSVAVHAGMHDFTGALEPNAAIYHIDKIEYLAEEVPPLAPTARRLNYCLVKVNNKMFFNDHVRPVCLSPASPPAGTICYTTGWGKTNNVQLDLFKGEARLQQVDQNITYDSSCLLGLNSTMTDLMLPVSICSGSSSKRGCLYDEGGPLVCQSNDDPSRWEVVGLMGRILTPTCHPEDLTEPHFIRVTNALQWIKDITGLSLPTTAPPSPVDTTPPNASERAPATATIRLLLVVAIVAYFHSICKL
ncbi:ovochymase-2-like [Paramacrobiotus metropolitanus]|uniref:ovochymase-2-like n=1 Tax=Paramacrobiotus metropolitanus TaxID=2943436 RepID=UPI00244606E8|nr:ovochymase-2-like [Paramacrobiotus metropolitanus]